MRSGWGAFMGPNRSDDVLALSIQHAPFGSIVPSSCSPVPCRSIVGCGGEMSVPDESVMINAVVATTGDEAVMAAFEQNKNDQARVSGN